MFSHLFKCNHPTHISTFQSPLYSNHSYRKIHHSNGCCSILAVHLKQTEFRRFKRPHCRLQSKLKVLIGFLSSLYTSFSNLSGERTKGVFIHCTQLIHIIDSSGEKYDRTTFSSHLIHLIRRNDVLILSILLIGISQAYHR